MTEEQPIVQVQQPAPQPPKKKKKGLTENQKSWLTFGSIAVIAVAGGAYLLLLGSEQDTISKQLALDVKSFEGKGYQQKLGAFVNNEMTSLGYTDNKEAQAVTEMLNALDSTVTFSEIKQFSDSKFGGVNIANATLKTNAKTLDGAGSFAAQEDDYTDVVIKQTPEEPKKYLFSYNAVSKQFDGVAPTPVMQTKMDGVNGYLEFNPNNTFKGTEANFKKISFTDGSGSMVYATVDGGYSKFTYAASPTQTDMEAVFRADTVTPGDTIKMMLGELKPLKVAVDFSYHGDPVAKLQRATDKPFEETVGNLEKDPATVLAEAGTAEKFNGQIKLNDFTLLSGEMGVVSNFDLTFQAFPYQPVPKGNISFTIKNYNDIIVYARNFMPIDQAEVDKQLFEAKEYFTDNGKDLVFTATLDGTRNIVLGTGKKIDIVEEYKADKAKAEAQAAPAAPAVENKFETEVPSDSTPVSVPEVQQRELSKPVEPVAAPAAAPLAAPVSTPAVQQTQDKPLSKP